MLLFTQGLCYTKFYVEKLETCFKDNILYDH